MPLKESERRRISAQPAGVNNWFARWRAVIAGYPTQEATHEIVSVPGGGLAERNFEDHKALLLAWQDDSHGRQ